MAEVQTPPGASAKDTMLITLAFIAIFGGIVAFYWYDDRPLLLRVGMVVAGVVGGLALAWLSSYGHEFWQFALASRIELRKVVWPGREETIRTTTVVFIFAAIMGVFFWGLDWVLTLLTRLLSGQSV
ncbi:MAG TPA: preprotein translocase subunit SecE [Steroidobacteraceae bacterium]|nr:preprotein translocase subunit SecE [Steroidobacteraceae bacterium]